MPTDRTVSNHVDAMFLHLARSAARGNRAKRRLARALAQLSAEKLREVSPAIFAQLGPVGLAEFAARSKIMSKTLAVKISAAGPARITAKSRLTSLIGLREWWHFGNPFIKAAIVAYLSALVGVAVSVAFNCAMIIWPPPVYRIGTWPVCSTLDSWTDGCAYVVPQNGVTLSMLSVPLNMPARHLAFNNDIGADVPLRQGSTVIILRATLWGNHQ